MYITVETATHLPYGLTSYDRANSAADVLQRFTQSAQGMAPVNRTVVLTPDPHEARRVGMPGVVGQMMVFDISEVRSVLVER